jgi:hypothetical protein
MEFLKTILTPYKLNLNYDNTLNLAADVNFSNHQMVNMDQRDALSPITQANHKLMHSIRVGGPDALNVYLVDSITPIPGTPGLTTNGVCFATVIAGTC